MTSGLAERTLPSRVDDGNQYVYGAGLESMVTASGTYYYLADGLGSTMAIVDTSGAVQKSYTYDVYGKPTPTGSLANEFDFAGQQTDANTGFQYLRARYYDTETGRFASREPMAVAPGWTLNPSGYAAANPVRFSDPNGLWPGEKKLKKAKEVAKSAGGTVVSGVSAGGGAVASVASTAWDEREAILRQCISWGVGGAVYGAATGGAHGAAVGAAAGCAMGAASQLASHVDGPVGAALQCGIWAFGTAVSGGGTIASGAACAAGVVGMLIDGQSNQCGAWGVAGFVGGIEALVTQGRSGAPAIGAVAGCLAAAASTDPKTAYATPGGLGEESVE